MTSTKGHPEVLKANINAPHLEKSEYVLKELIGDATEAVAFVNGHACLALLDTGSQVTSIAKSFYDRHLFNQPIEPIENIVRVVGAGGQEVPFLGYATIHVSFPENDVGIQGTLTTLPLVVPNNSYNQRVSVIIGTNYGETMQKCMSTNCGAELPANCQSFICLETSIPIRPVTGSISSTIRQFLRKGKINESSSNHYSFT